MTISENWTNKSDYPLHILIKKITLNKIKPYGTAHNVPTQNTLHM